MDFLLFILSWVILSACVGGIAERKGANGGLAIVVALVFSPLVGLLFALAQPANQAKLISRELATGSVRKCPACSELIKNESYVCKFCRTDFRTSENAISLSQSITPKEDTKKCPFCAEDIKVGAVICRFCNRDVPLKGEPSSSKSTVKSIQQIRSERDAYRRDRETEVGNDVSKIRKGETEFPITQNAVGVNRNKVLLGVLGLFLSLAIMFFAFNPAIYDFYFQSRTLGLSLQRNKSPIEMSGQVFIVTQGDANIKLGDVEISFYNLDQISDIFKQKRELARKQALAMQPDVQSDYSKYITANKIYDSFQEQHPENTDPKIIEVAGQVDSIHETYQSERSKQLLYFTGDYYFSSLPLPLKKTTTNSEGIFKVSLPVGQYAILAHASRNVGDDTEGYFWAVRYDVSDNNNNNESAILTNSNLWTSGSPSSLLANYKSEDLPEMKESYLDLTATDSRTETPGPLPSLSQPATVTIESRTISPEGSPPAIPNPKTPIDVLMKTSLGDVTVELDPIHAPVSVANFLSYVDNHSYDNTIFHRVVPGFCVQGGGFNVDFTKEISDGHVSIKDEGRNGLQNSRGTITMARTNDPDSATSEFFFNLVDNTTMLDAGGASGPDGYAVFGHVTSGMEVIDKISSVETTTKVTGAGNMENVPVKPVVILSISKIPANAEPPSQAPAVPSDSSPPENSGTVQTTPSPQDDTQVVTSTVRSFVDSSNSISNQDESSFYADLTDYFDNGEKDLDFIRSDILAYNQKWSERRNAMTNLQIDQIGDRYRASYTFEYTATDQAGKIANGKLNLSLVLKQIDGTYKIIDIKTQATVPAINLTTSETGDSQDVLNEIKILTERFIESSNSTSSLDELTFYAPTVDYFDDGMKDVNYISRDINNYNTKWKTRTYTVNNILVANPGINQFVVSCNVTYTVSNSAAGHSGNVTDVITFQLIDGEYKITAVKETDKALSKQ